MNKNNFIRIKFNDAGDESLSHTLKAYHLIDKKIWFMKIKFALGPYGYEVVIGNISEQVYNKYSQDNDALRDALSGFEEDPEIKEWSDMDDIAHNYGAVIEEEGTDQYLKIVNENNEELLNIPLILDEIQNKDFNIKEDIKHSLEEDLSDKFYFFGQSGEKGEWENLDHLFEVSEFKPSEFNIHIANLDGLKIIYAISYKNNEKTLLSVESSNPNFQNFEVRMGDDVWLKEKTTKAENTIDDLNLLNYFEKRKECQRRADMADTVYLGKKRYKYCMETILIKMNKLLRIVVLDLRIIVL